MFALKYCFVIILFFLTTVTQLQAFSIPAHPVGAVNDYGQLLSGNSANSLEHSLQVFGQQFDIELVVVTLNSMDRYDPQVLASDFFQTWNLGGSEQQAMLLLISSQEKEVAYHLGEGITDITHQEMTSFLNRLVIPQLAEGHYDQAITSMINAMRATLSEDVSIEQSSRPQTQVVMLIGVGLVLVLSELGHRMHPRWYVGIPVGLLVGVVSANVRLAAIFCAVGLIFGIVKSHLLNKVRLNAKIT